MYLVVKNFGPIKEARIDLNKKFTVLTGENNTGKTFLSKLLYVIFNKDTIENFSISSKFNKIVFPTDKDILKLNIENVDNLLDNFSDYIKNKALVDQLKLTTNTGFSLKFDFDMEVLKSKKLTSGTNISIKNEGGDGKDKDIEIFSLKKEIDSLDVNIKKLPINKIDDVLPPNFFDDVPRNKFLQDIEEMQKKSMGTSINISVLSMLLQNREIPYFFPSNRVSVIENINGYKRDKEELNKEFKNAFFKFLDDEGKSESARRSLLELRSMSKNLSYIDKIIDDLTKLHTSKNQDVNNKSPHCDDSLLSELRLLMGGDIDFKKDDVISDYYETFVNLDGENIPLDIASSSVNSLTLLYLYIKYWSKSEDNMIIIDEPEMNLHPKNQIYLARFLIKLINKGFKIVVSTHSDYIIREINSFALLGQIEDIEAKNKIILDNDLKDDLILDISEISMYSTKSGVVHPIELSKEGFIPETLEDQIEKSNYLSDEIYFQCSLEVGDE